MRFQKYRPKLIAAILFQFRLNFFDILISRLIPLESTFSSFSVESTRLKLWPYPNTEGSDYINANFVDVSFKLLYLIVAFLLQCWHRALLSFQVACLWASRFRSLRQVLCQ